MAVPAPPPLDPEYAARIASGLDRAFARATEQVLDPATARLVVFSDHHKGAGDAADDFRRSERAYTAALGYYLAAGHRLFVLGDAEELWEEKPEPVLDRYAPVFALEAEFAAAGRYERFWGNHDDQWESDWAVRRRLGKALPRIKVREGLKLRVRRDGKPDVVLFFVHGHQGTLESDRWGWLSRLAVRLFWRPLQRITGWSATTPARDFRLRAMHDRAMYDWARTRPDPVVLIAGHTHRPVFGRCTPPGPPARPADELRPLVAAATAAGEHPRAEALRAELEYALAVERDPDHAITVEPPCYFNTGCCSFPDGDVTGLELADGELRLVRWPRDLTELRAGDGGDIEAERRIREREALERVLDRVAGVETVDEEILAHPLTTSG
jgi:hypothetical protein